VIKAKFGPCLEHFAVDKKVDVVLRMYIELCQARGIGVFLLNMPESPEFRALRDDAANATLTKYLAGIEHDYHVPYLDASGWVGREGFTDGIHMNPSGAEQFTRRFGDVIFAPGGLAGR
jgi:lysophospholipase L1-like esterase